ncbi:MAG TPA: hypothetical protein EYN06_04425 [Myxococcales bacterium]|nr:hypothetical protein [Myxococcales bacterium]
MRYLDPGAKWTSKNEDRMRGHVRECSDCAGEYDRAVVMHREMVGSNPDMPSGFERGRMMIGLVDAVIEREQPRSSMAWVFSWRLVAGGIAAAIIAFVAFPQGGTHSVDGELPVHSAQGENYFGVRGHLKPQLRGGIGLSGVTEGKNEYEVLAGESTAFIADYLRIYTTRLDPELSYGFILGIQKTNPPIWYWPDPEAGEQGSRSLEVGVSVVLGGSVEPFEFDLSKKHQVGPLQVVAIFTASPLQLEKVRAAITSRPAAEPMESWLRAELGLDSRSVIRILDVKIAAGSRGMERP